METITAYLLEVERRTARVVTIKKSLGSYCEALGYNGIDINRRVIGREKREYGIICGDKSSINWVTTISGFTSSVDPMFYGNLLVVKCDEADNIVSLTEEDVKYLKRYTERFETSLSPNPYPSLICVEYK